MIDWNTAPKWARYAAMDSDERWWWHGGQPVVDGPIWAATAAWPSKQFTAEPYCGHWSESLQERPKMRTRIIERTRCDGAIFYVIQQKHLLFRWLWVDAHINSAFAIHCVDTFTTLEDAKKHLCFFNGTPKRERVVYG